MSAAPIVGLTTVIKRLNKGLDKPDLFLGFTAIYHNLLITGLILSAAVLYFFDYTMHCVGSKHFDGVSWNKVCESSGVFFEYGINVLSADFDPNKHRTFLGGYTATFLLALEAALLYVPRQLWLNGAGKIIQRSLLTLTPVHFGRSKDERQHYRDTILSNFKVMEKHRWIVFVYFAIQLFMCFVISVPFIMYLVYNDYIAAEGSRLDMVTTWKDVFLTHTSNRTDTLYQLFPTRFQCYVDDIGVSGTSQAHNAVCWSAANLVFQKVCLVQFWVSIPLAALALLDIGVQAINVFAFSKNRVRRFFTFFLIKNYGEESLQGIISLEPPSVKEL